MNLHQYQVDFYGLVLKESRKSKGTLYLQLTWNPWGHEIKVLTFGVIQAQNTMNFLCKVYKFDSMNLHLHHKLKVFGKLNIVPNYVHQLLTLC